MAKFGSHISLTPDEVKSGRVPSDLGRWSEELDARLEVAARRATQTPKSRDMKIEPGTSTISPFCATVLMQRMRAIETAATKLAATAARIGTNEAKLDDLEGPCDDIEKALAPGATQARRAQFSRERLILEAAESSRDRLYELGWEAIVQRDRNQEWLDNFMGEAAAQHLRAIGIAWSTKKLLYAVMSASYEIPRHEGVRARKRRAKLVRRRLTEATVEAKHLLASNGLDASSSEELAATCRSSST